MPDQDALEAGLRRLATAIQYPPTPDFRLAVERRIAARQRRPWRRPGRLALAAAVLLAAALVGAVSVPPVRQVVAEWIGLGRIRVERVPALPGPTPLPPGRVRGSLHLGSQVTLAEAATRLGRPVLSPSALGDPDAVYWESASHFVSLVYLPRAGLPETSGTGVAVLVMEARGSVEYPFLAKMAGPGTRFEEVTVQGVKGGWLEGSPHAVAFFDPSGKFVTDDVRLAANVLIWSSGDMTYRIESSLTKERVLPLAASLR